MIKSPISERDSNILMHAVRGKVCIYIGLQNYRNGPNGGKGRLQRKTESRLRGFVVMYVWRRFVRLFRDVGNAFPVTYVVISFLLMSH